MSRYAPVDPKQSFPALEEDVLERWRQGETFRRQLEARAGRPLWSFYEGPPTANGKPGSHHVLARVFKDIYPRYKSMCGFDVPRKGGWDCHGLPVELEIEKQLGISSKEEIEAFGIAEFNQRCRESVFAYVGDWNRMVERVGHWIDLDDPYVTMDTDYIESVWWSLRRNWDDGRLYEGHKVVPYCPRCGTALSSHEVGGRLQGRRRPVRLRPPAGHRAGGTARGRRQPACLDDDAVDADRPRRRRGRPGGRLRTGGAAGRRDRRRRAGARRAGPRRGLRDAGDAARAPSSKAAATRRRSGSSPAPSSGRSDTRC